MTVNRSIFAFIKSPLTLLFICGFIVALAGCVVYAISTTPLKSQCAVDFSFYDIRKNDNVTLTRGMYRTYRDGYNKGHITFIGSISRFNETEALAPPIPVHRELSFTAQLYRNLVQMSVVNQSPRLGDKSSDDDVMDYVFPQISPGGSNTTAMYLLDGKVLAAGSEEVARSVCIN